MGKKGLICKGVHIVQAQKWIDRQLGEGACQKIATEQLGPQSTSWQLILPSSKYELDDLFAVLQEASKRTKISVEQMTTEIAMANAEQDLKSIYRAFLRIVKPVRVLSFMPEIWKSYFQFGAINVTTNEPGLFEMECSGIPKEYNDWIIGGWKGFLPVTINVAGGSAPVCEVIGDRSAADLTVRIRARYRA